MDKRIEKIVTEIFTKKTPDALEIKSIEIFDKRTSPGFYIELPGNYIVTYLTNETKRNEQLWKEYKSGFFANFFESSPGPTELRSLISIEDIILYIMDKNQL